MKLLDYALGGIRALNVCALQLAITRPQNLRRYLRDCVSRYDELAGVGLPHRDPISYIVEQGWGQFSPRDRVELPTRLEGGSGAVELGELLILATVTRVLKPRRVFEIGTYTGLTTSVFVLNAPCDATVVTLDLPPFTQLSDAEGSVYVSTDVGLVRERQLGRHLKELNLQGRYQQILCNSLEFDPSPYRESIELAFIDGAHALPYVKNDTEKTAAMMSDRGIVFWHDYGGRGEFRPLCRYLDSLSKKIPLYRIIATGLAWTSGPSLRKFYHS